MRGRYRVVVSASRRTASADPPQGLWARLKAAIIGIACVVAGLGVLVAALIFGSILAAVLCVCLVLVIAVVLLKTPGKSSGASYVSDLPQIPGTVDDETDELLIAANRR